MSPIFSALATIAGIVTPSIYARQKSNLQPASLGYGSTVPELERWDADIAMGIESQIVFVDTELDNAAGERFTWPFDETDSLTLWPSKTPDERTKVVGDIARLGAEAAIRRVWGDLRTQADTRAGLPFSAQGKSLYAQGDTFLNSAKAKIAGALAALDKASGGFVDETDASAFSGSVPVVSTW